MPVALAQKIAGICPEYQGELSAFVDFLLFRQAFKRDGDLAASTTSSQSAPNSRELFWDAFERIRERSSIVHKDHEWTMDEINAEIAAARKERRERQMAGMTI